MQLLPHVIIKASKSNRKTQPKKKVAEGLFSLSFTLGQKNNFCPLVNTLQTLPSLPLAMPSPQKKRERNLKESPGVRRNIPWYILKVDLGTERKIEQTKKLSLIGKPLPLGIVTKKTKDLNVAWSCAEPRLRLVEQGPPDGGFQFVLGVLVAPGVVLLVKSLPAACCGVTVPHCSSTPADLMNGLVWWGQASPEALCASLHP